MKHFLPGCSYRRRLTSSTDYVIKIAQIFMLSNAGKLHIKQHRISN